MNSSTLSRQGRLGLMLCVALLACTASGCLCAFHRDWQEAQTCCPPSDNLAGLWEGTWVSHTNGHNGKLRAIFTDCGNGQYRAQYQGTFHLVIPFVYETTHQRTKVEPGITYFSAREDLGLLVGGTFQMNGWANGQTFVACYRSSKDHGVFKMTRVGSCGCCSTDACCDIMPYGDCE